MLVLAAPLLGGALTTTNGWRAALLATASFTFASAGTYLLNDARDADADRLHPTKRLRPVAAGTVSVKAAIATGIALMALALLIGVVALPPSFVAVLAAYLVTTIAYQIGAKDAPLWELAIVASGFVLRLIAGGVATGTPLSSWFLIVGGGGAFFVVVTKRRAEIEDMGEAADRHRPALGGYSRELLLMAQSAALAVSITAYALWAFTDSPVKSGSVWIEVSIIPLLLAMLRFAQQAEMKRVSAPEEVLLRDRQLIALGTAWVLLVAIGIGAAP